MQDFSRVIIILMMIITPRIKPTQLANIVTLTVQWLEASLIAWHPWYPSGEVNTKKQQIHVAITQDT